MELLNSDPHMQDIFVLVSQHLAKQQTLPQAYVRVSVVPIATTLTVKWQNQAKIITITVPSLVYLGRCLSLAVSLPTAAVDTVVEPVLFPEVAFSLDLSRNGVLHVAIVKKMLVYAAVMGYTHLYLYLEDTFTVPGEPYHGYLRGRYSETDLREIDDFAARLQIEVVPAIQTLAHLDQLLQWAPYESVREDQHTLLVGEPVTYKLISQWLRTLSAIFRSRRIHLGLDEATGVGHGQYLQHHAYQDQRVLISEHITKVVALCRDLGLRPEIWSDFIYHALDLDQLPGYYPVAARLDKTAAAALPKDIAYGYWDYGERDEANYRRRLQKHRLFGDHIHFAGAVHTYGNLVPNYGKSWQALAPALAACQAEKVEQVMCTTWGDDGQEAAHWLALPVLQLFAERCYHQDVDLALAAERFNTCVQSGIFMKLWNLDLLNQVPGVEAGNYWMANPSKYLLWQDPLLGAFDEDVYQYQQTTGVSLDHYYHQQETLQMVYPQYSGIWQQIINFYRQLTSVLALKSDLGLRLRQAYMVDDRAELTTLHSTVLPKLQQAVQQLAKQHELIWRATYRANGWEVLESRYATLSSRLVTTQDLLAAYLHGERSSLDILASPRLPFIAGTPLVRLSVTDYRRIAFSQYN